MPRRRPDTSPRPTQTARPLAGLGLAGLALAPAAGAADPGAYSDLLTRDDAWTLQTCDAFLDDHDEDTPLRYAAEMAICVEPERNVYGPDDGSEILALDDQCAAVREGGAPCAWWGDGEAAEHESYTRCNELVSRAFGRTRRAVEPSSASDDPDTPYDEATRYDNNHTSFSGGWCRGVADEGGTWRYPIFEQTALIGWDEPVGGNCAVDTAGLYSGGSPADEIDPDDGRASCRGSPLAYLWREMIAAGDVYTEIDDEPPGACGAIDPTPDSEWPWVPRGAAPEIAPGDVIAVAYEDSCGAPVTLGAPGAELTVDGWTLIGGTSRNVCDDWEGLGLWAPGAPAVVAAPAARDPGDPSLGDTPGARLAAMCDRHYDEIEDAICEVTGHVMFAASEPVRIGAITAVRE